jgi:hypothetical protein
MGHDGNPPKVGQPTRAVGLWAGVIGLLVAGGAGAWLLRTPPAAVNSPACAPVIPSACVPDESLELDASVREFCTACHAFPPPSTFPRSAWAGEVEQAYGFARDSTRPLRKPPFDSVVGYFEDRAPLELPPVRFEQAPAPPTLSFHRTGFAAPRHPKAPAVSSVRLVHLFDKDRLDVLACDMRRGRVMVLSPYAEAPAWKVLAEVPNPAHAEVVDLDKDGIPDILVANLGSYLPTDSPRGSVVWLRGWRDRTFTPITLSDGIGRVADVRAADFNGDGKIDLVVAAFGWRTVGSIYLLRNKTTDWSQPVFEREQVDDRHGTIHVPVCDLNHDGKPDFVALVGQEHETIVAFLNEGGGRFRKETIYAAPHPAYSSSGIELVDLDGDGDLDVLYTNGDVLDKPYLLKPYHGVQWLENRGSFPFTHHPLTPLYGAHQAVAGDVDGDGLLDVVAVSFLPEEGFPVRKDLDAVVLLRQEERGRFVRYGLEKTSPTAQVT